MPKRSLAALPLAVATALTAAALAGLAATPLASAQAPSDPYAGLTQRTGDALRDALHKSLLHIHRRLSWNATKSVVISADRAGPAEPLRVLDIYSNALFAAEIAGPDEWDREHLWPRSLMGYPVADAESPCNIDYTDVHLLFAAWSTYNESRGNLWFDDVNAEACRAPGADCERPVVGSDAPNRRLGDAWEVWPGRRVDVARALLYADVRYAGGDRVNACIERDLVLTDTLRSVTPTAVLTATGYMGKLSTLLRWHIEDPVGLKDRQHNDAVAAYNAQGNRNPLTDHPEFVCRVWSVGICETWRPRAWLPHVVTP